MLSLCQFSSAETQDTIHRHKNLTEFLVSDVH